MAHASFAKSYYCTVLPTIAFYFLPYTMRSTLTRSSHGSDRQSGRGSLPHLASLPIPSLGAGRPAVLLAPSTTLATTTTRRCGAPACLHHACARWLRAANRWRPPREQWATPPGSARGEGPPHRVGRDCLWNVSSAMYEVGYGWRDRGMPSRPSNVAVSALCCNKFKRVDVSMSATDPLLISIK